MVSEQKKGPMDLFYSYFHKDEEMRDELETHLALLKRKGTISGWRERRIAAGQEWKGKINERVNSARVILLLVSADFVASDYCRDMELSRALERHQAREAVVIPVILRPCDWHNAPFGKLEALPEDGKPVSRWPTTSEAFLDVARGIREAVENLLHPSTGSPHVSPATTGATAHAPIAHAPSAHTPSVHNLPLAPIGDQLRGRDGELAQMLAETGAAAIPLAIQGPGGVGKTRLAVEFAWRAMREGRHHAALFALAHSTESIMSNLAGMAGTLGLPQAKEHNEALSAKAVLRWLGTNDGWLLVLDDVDDDPAVATVRALLPRLSRGRVLITSRRTDWAAGVRPVNLKPLATDEAARFLLDRAADRRRAPADGADARRLAEILGGLPLALEQAGAYIARRKCALADYLLGWDDDRRRVLKWANPKDNASIAVAVTLERTHAALSPTARALLSLCCFLAPDPIPLSLAEEGERQLATAASLLESNVGQAPPPAAPSSKTSATGAHETIDAGGLPSGARAMRPREALSELARYSTIERQARSFSVHRQVQEAMRLRIPDARRRRWLECVLQWVYDAAPAEAADARTWTLWDALRPHALAIVEEADAAGIPEPTARLMGGLGHYFDAKGRVDRAERWLRRALAFVEKTYGPEDPKVAVPLNDLAQLLRAANRLSEAEPLKRRIAEVLVKDYGEDHPNVATALNNLALLLKDMNRLSEAEPLMRRALAIWEESLGPEHPNVASALSNLAQLLAATNRLSEAEPLMRRALAIEQAFHGPDDPKVAVRLNNLAALYQATNRLPEAEPLMRRVVEILEKAYGKEHPNVATELNNLASLLKATNRLSEAESLYRQALAIDEAASGPDHPSVAIVLVNLGALLRNTGRAAQGKPMVERALRIFSASLGPDHPHTQNTARHLASFEDS